MKRRHLLLISVIFVISYLSAGCVDSPYAEFNGIYVGETACSAKFAHFKSTFYQVIMKNHSAHVLLMQDAKRELENDIISINYLGRTEPEIGKTYSLVSPIDPKALFVGKIVSNQSCGNNKHNFYILGDLELTHYTTVPGKIISGVVKNARVINGDNGKVEIKDYSGNFTVLLKKGPPYRPFNP